MRQVWLADAVDNVFDITSRPFILFFSSEIGPDRIERLKQNKQIVFRTRLTCNDACSKGSAWNRAEIKNDRKEEREDHQAHCTKCINTARGKKTSCSWLLAHQKAQRKKTCSVQLIVRVQPFPFLACPPLYVENEADAYLCRSKSTLLIFRDTLFGSLTHTSVRVVTQSTFVFHRISGARSCSKHPRSLPERPIL